ncbi:MAG TPA: PHB depolymerase family esterase [Polyangiaceae bacterium]|jgi:polyhydroxybutyrate depolymerase
MRPVALFFVALAPFALACSGEPSRPRSSEALTVSGRQYFLKIPAGYDGSDPRPLVIAIHGYGTSAEYLEGYFGLDPLADARGFFVVYPEGTIDASGRRFFSATDACCDFYGTGVDDVRFLSTLLDELEATYAIDPARVFVVGHSNGGFMGYRLACDLSSRIAAVVSLSGAMWKDPARCRPTSDVSILEVHGTDDAIILPQGGYEVDGHSGRVYPTLEETVSSWAGFDACANDGQPGPDPGHIDAETTLPASVTRWGTDADVELWKISGGTHVPRLTSAWAPAIVDFLMAHPKVAVDPDEGPDGGS